VTNATIGFRRVYLAAAMSPWNSRAERRAGKSEKLPKKKKTVPLKGNRQGLMFSICVKAFCGFNNIEIRGFSGESSS
jgi:hypothetical protein